MSTLERKTVWGVGGGTDQWGSLSRSGGDGKTVDGRWVPRQRLGPGRVECSSTPFFLCRFLLLCISLETRHDNIHDMFALLQTLRKRKASDADGQLHGPG